MLREEEVVRAAVAAHGFPAAEKFVQEVLWRTYWKGWLEQRPWVWSDYLAYPREPTIELSRALLGKTGIQCFDAWVDELRSTGYLHNHARMWFASIWIFTLGLPWQWGADFFWRELLDRDAASNTLSWRWVAGLQTKGKHYIATEENIARFTAGRFPLTPGLKTGPAIVWDGLPDRAPVPLQLFPSPPKGEVALLIHAEDLTLEDSEISSQPVRRIGVLSEAFTPGSPSVQRWSRAALEDAAARAEAHFGAKAEWIEPTEEALPPVLSRFAKGLPLVGAAPFVGPVKDLEISCLGFRRAHDLALFPFAQRGFFSFRPQIPHYVKNLG